VFSTIDRGRARTTGDDLSIVGEKNASSLSSVLSLLYWHEIGEINASHVSMGAMTHQVFETLERYPEAREASVYSKTFYRKIHLQPRVLGYLHVMFGRF